MNLLILLGGRKVTWAVRLSDIVFCAAVAGINGQYLQNLQAAGKDPKAEHTYMYSTIVAGLGMLFCLIAFLPQMQKFWHWPADLALSLMFGIAAGLLSEKVQPICAGIGADTKQWHWSGLTNLDVCNKAKADFAFTLLTSLFFAATGFVVGVTPATYARDGREVIERRNTMFRREVRVRE